MFKRKRMTRDVADFVGATVVLGAGGSAVSSIPGAPAGASRGLQTMAGFMPAVATVKGAGYVIGGLEEVSMARKRRKRRRR